MPPVGAEIWLLLRPSIRAIERIFCEGFFPLCHGFRFRHVRLLGLQPATHARTSMLPCGIRINRLASFSDLSGILFALAGFWLPATGLESRLNTSLQRDLWNSPSHRRYFVAHSGRFGCGGISPPVAHGACALPHPLPFPPRYGPASLPIRANLVAGAGIEPARLDYESSGLTVCPTR